jgi:UDP-N-acetylglucosamine 2-epimerase
MGAPFAARSVTLSAMRIVAVNEGADEGAAALLAALEERVELRRVALEPDGASELKRMSAAISELECRLEALRPAAVLVSGDGVAALAGALVAAKLEMPLVRLGAGIRSGDRHEAVEINRSVADHVCELLLCVDEDALAILTREGLDERAAVVTHPTADPAPAADAVLAWLDSYTSRA